MSQQTINVGAAPNDGTGTPLRTAFQYTNSNFTELYTALGGGAGLPGATTQVIFNDGGTNLAGDAGLTYNKTTDTLSMGAATITGDLTVDTSTLKVDSANNRVGIVTASPTTPLDVVGPGDGDLRIRAGSDASIIFSETAANKNWKVKSSAGTFSFQYSATAYNSGYATLANLDSSGNLGLGVTPSAWSGNYRVLEIGKSGNAFWGQTSPNGVFMSSNCYLNSGGQFIYSASSILSTYYTQNTGRHEWYTAPSGTAGNAITFTQAMTLDASGNLLVGKTANYGTGETSSLQLKGILVFASDNTGSASNRNWAVSSNLSAAGNIEWTVSSSNNGWPNFAYRMQLTSAGAAYNTTGTWGTISDLRLKENISDARNYLSDLLKLRVVKYSLKEEASAVATKIGFIAQEVEQVFPNLIEKSDKEYEGGEGIRTVKTTVLIPMLLKAIQELTARVIALENK